MRTKFSEDVVPLTDLKVNPGRVVKHAADAQKACDYLVAASEAGQEHQAA